VPRVGCSLTQFEDACDFDREIKWERRDANGKAGVPPGFAEDLDAILEATPKTRQTALFSATMPTRILAIAQRHLKDPARVTIFESLGIAVEDAAAAGYVYEQAVAKKIGRPFP